MVDKSWMTNTTKQKRMKQCQIKKKKTVHLNPKCLSYCNSLNYLLACFTNSSCFSSGSVSTHTPTPQQTPHWWAIQLCTHWLVCSPITWILSSGTFVNAQNMSRWMSTRKRRLPLTTHVLAALHTVQNGVNQASLGNLTFLRAPEGFLRRHPQRIGKRQFKLFNGWKFRGGLSPRWSSTAKN